MIREVIDPKATRKASSSEAGTAVDPRLQTRATICSVVAIPIVQTGMGWVAGAG